MCSYFVADFSEMTSKTKSKIAVIGAGFSGLSTAAFLAAKGHEVTVYEKHDQAGGRARVFKEKGFTFDMGPSWYWMPDVFERFFQQFGYQPEDFYTLKKLDPAFTMVFEDHEQIDVPADYSALRELFERIEPGSSTRLDQFMQSAERKYQIGMQDLVYKPGLSVFEFFNIKTFKGALQLDILSDFRTYVGRYFKDARLRALMEFPILFLGAQPQRTPALYSLMNYAGLVQGTFYPMGGFGKVVEGMVKVAKRVGVRFEMGRPIEKILTERQQVIGLQTAQGNEAADTVITGADYHHSESLIDSSNFRNYTERYWDTRTFAPSCLLFYLGISQRVNRLGHHTLFFDADLDVHAHQIYEQPAWPDAPLFYVCAPSKTDDSVAPLGCENLFLLMPIAPGLKDDAQTRERYFEEMMCRLEKYTGQNLREMIIYKRSYCVNDFISDYSACKGNAYGLANTLKQTAILKPSIRSKKLKNLFFTGQLTVPGPGVPPALISGEIAAKLVHNQYLES